MSPTPNIKGIRIRTVNMVMLAMSLILFMLVLYTTVQISRQYKSTINAMDNYMEWESAARVIQHGTDYLTEQARLYARTLNKKYADNYFHELYEDRSREKAIELLTENDRHNHAEEQECALARALELSNSLAYTEIYAIRLLAEATHQNIENFPASVRNIRLTSSDRLMDSFEKIERARNLLFNNEYQEGKREILDTLAGFMKENLDNTRLEMKIKSSALGAVLAEERLLIIALCLLNILTFAMIIVLIVKPLQIYLKCIKDDKMFEIVGAYEFKHLALTYNDIFAIKEHHDRMLKHKAEHDPLTGLLNRAAFDSLRQILAHDDKPVGFLLLDVDKFKEVNDTYGHEIGDKTLCRVAWLLQHSFRSDDMCIRLGGDEFAVILRGNASVLEQIVKEKIDSINNALQNPHDNVPPTSISVGVAFSNAGFSADLYNHADQALYKVKEAGRKGCRFYGENI